MGKWTPGLTLAIEAKECLATLSRLDQIAADVEGYTVRDLRRWLPGHVSSAVSKIYHIRKSEVAACQAPFDADNGRHRGRNAGKASVRTSFSGYSLESFSVTFRGKVLSTWMTKAKPKPKKVAGKAYSSKKVYYVTQEVFRNQPVRLTPRGDNRIFVINNSAGRMQPMVRYGEEVFALATSSVPHAILNEKTVAIWRPQMNEYLLKRFNHHAKRLFPGR